MLLYSFVSCFLISPVTSSSTHWLFRSMLLNFHTVVFPLFSFHYWFPVLFLCGQKTLVLFQYFEIYWDLLLCIQCIWRRSHIHWRMCVRCWVVILHMSVRSTGFQCLSGPLAPYCPCTGNRFLTSPSSITRLLISPQENILLIRSMTLHIFWGSVVSCLCVYNYYTFLMDWTS